VLPFYARLYIWLKSRSNSYIFIYRASDMVDIFQEVSKGQEGSGVDLVRILRKDLQAYVKKY
jgi:hypothetical protein